MYRSNCTSSWFWCYPELLLAKRAPFYSKKLNENGVITATTTNTFHNSGDDNYVLELQDSLCCEDSQRARSTPHHLYSK